MPRWAEVGMWRVWRRCRTGRGAPLLPAGEGPVLGPACIATRRSHAAPPALSIRQPLRPAHFCRAGMPAVRRPWDCPGEAQRQTRPRA